MLSCSHDMRRDGKPRGVPLDLFDQESLAFFSLDPAGFATAATPRRACFRIAIPGRDTTLGDLRGGCAAPTPKDLLGSQRVFGHTRANFRENDVKLSQASLFCLLSELFSLRLQFEICWHRIDSYRMSSRRN
ncbi:hypothetical protein WQ49_20260 [Burkholderia cenocepacia]|nr:hypothetical protein WQ49_20260 [Burkholderia cenocepacia]